MTVSFICIDISLDIYIEGSNKDVKCKFNTCNQLQIFYLPSLSGNKKETGLIVKCKRLSVDCSINVEPPKIGTMHKNRCNS